jgi:hypothetical protein
MSERIAHEWTSAAINVAGIVGVTDSLLEALMEEDHLGSLSSSGTTRNSTSRTHD